METDSRVLLSTIFFGICLHCFRHCTVRTTLHKMYFSKCRSKSKLKRIFFFAVFLQIKLLALFTLFAAKVCQEMPKDFFYGFILRRLRASFSAKRPCFLFTKCLKLRAYFRIFHVRTQTLTNSKNNQ